MRQFTPYNIITEGIRNDLVSLIISTLRSKKFLSAQVYFHHITIQRKFSQEQLSPPDKTTIQLSLSGSWICIIPKIFISSCNTRVNLQLEIFTQLTQTLIVNLV